MPAPQVAAEGAADEGWRGASARRDWRAAYDALGHDALVEMTPTAPLADLLLIADVARLSDHPADAIAPRTARTRCRWLCPTSHAITLGCAATSVSISPGGTASGSVIAMSCPGLVSIAVVA